MLNQMSYNLEIKIAGKHVTLKKLSKNKPFNYEVKNPPSQSPKGESNSTKENFLKSIIRARKRVFDIIACNVNVIPDLHGDIQRPKFWTLTFGDHVTDLEIANEEFTKFNKRLSWSLYGVRKNVLKYICIPEFMKNGRVHYHILYFNLPYVEHKKFQAVWGKGHTFVKSVSKKENIMDFASYVAKYMNKENSKGEDNYDIYLEKDMLNKKRYFCSRGLNKPEIYKLDIDKELYESLVAMLQDFHSFNAEYKNEFIGDVQINSYEIEDKKVIKSIVNAVNTMFSIMKGVYDKQVKIRFKNVCKYLLPDTFYSIEKVKKNLWKKFEFIEVPVNNNELRKLGWL